MSMFAQKITEEQFFSDLEKAKICVDNGIRDWFIYAFPSSVQGMEAPKNTLLKDIIDVFGVEYVHMFRFAAMMDSGSNGALKAEYQSIQIRMLTNTDRRILSETIRFFPKDTWVCDWRDGTGEGGIWPFVQNEKTGEIEWLFLNPIYRKTKLPSNSSEDCVCFPTMYTSEMLDVMPDYWDMQLAKVRYKDVDILIPLAGDTAKYTFKNRDRDEFGVKRHIVHSVKSHKRINTEDEIERHLRGRSDFTINGEKICVMAAISFAYDYFNKPKTDKRKKKRKK